MPIPGAGASVRAIFGAGDAGRPQAEQEGSRCSQHPHSRRPAGGAGGAGGLISFVPIVLIFAIMYFLMIRPQQKKVKEHKAMVEALRRGDQVVTSGGLIGKVTKVDRRRGRGRAGAPTSRCGWCSRTISQVVSKTEPAEA